MERDEPSDAPQPASLPAHLASRVEAIVRAAEQEAAAIQREIEAQRRVAETESRRYLVEARRQADALADQRMRRLRELTDELIERAEATKHQFDALLAALQRASAGIESGLDAPAPAAGAPRMPRAGERPTPVQPTSAPAAVSEPSLPAPAPSARADALARATEREVEASAPAEHAASESIFTPPAPADYAGPPAGGARPGAELDSPGPGAESQAPRQEGLGAARLVAIEMAVAGRTRAEVDRHLRDSFRIEDTADLLDDVFGAEGASRPSWRGA
jgi:hypothetical protein